MYFLSITQYSDIPVAHIDIESYVSILCQRVHTGGGFANNPGAVYRPDSTAWAILALAGVDARTDLIDAARARLSVDQGTEGQINISPEHPQVFWPTALAVLAWHGSSRHRKELELAARFLLRARGRAPYGGLDISPPLPPDGWPWIAGTHTWVEPTAMSLLALRTAGYGGHRRCREGERMLMDRQLPHGGWNCGSTVVYGQELRPQVDSTGIALTALAGRAPREAVGKSVDYLKEHISRVRTPLSLAWGLLGLGAWGERPEKAQQWIAESFALQERYGSFNTALISLLLIAYGNSGWPGAINGAKGSDWAG